MKETTYTRQEMLKIFNTPIREMTREEQQYVVSGQMMRETRDLYFLRRKGKGERDIPRLQRWKAGFWVFMVHVISSSTGMPERLIWSSLVTK